MKILHYKKIIFILTFNLLSANCFALSCDDNSCGTTNKKSSSDYAQLNRYSNGYYEKEGDLMFKVRGFFISTEAEISGLPAPMAGQSNPSSLSEAGFGADTSMTFFFTNHFASELFLGLQVIPLRGSSITQIAQANGLSVTTKNSDNFVFGIPIGATVQYHIAPYGAIRPYVGGGYAATFMRSKVRALETSSSTGAVLQAGIDFVAKDDTLISLDVKQFFSESKIRFNTNQVGGGISARVKWNPLTIALGFGFRF